MAVLDDFAASQTFRLLTTASPDRVWSVLTCPEQTIRYLHGMSVRSSWEPGASVRFIVGDHEATAGQVLCTARPHHLSYCVEDDSGPATYVTWLLRPVADGCVVRLQVSETDCGGTTEDELEDVWLPVVEALRGVLDGDQQS